jgi:SAM-dependent methyltransferase
VKPNGLDQVPFIDIIKNKDPFEEEAQCTELESKETVAKSGSKWEDFLVEKWRSAVYVNKAYFGDLLTDQVNFVANAAEQIKLSGRRVSLIEVGCGTGEFIRDSADTFRVAVGLDFNPHFIQYCEESIPKGMEARQRYIHGDACKLTEEMEKHFPKKEGLLWNDVRVVACVGNTIGIIPQELKAKVYEEMLNLAGDDGIMIMAYWNARWFGDAVQNFYHANPQLCGPFSGESIDMSTCTLKTPSGYCTHWTSLEEAREVMEGLGVEIISIRDQGKGVLVAARRLPKENASFKPPQRDLAPAPASSSGAWYAGIEEDQ